MTTPLVQVCHVPQHFTTKLHRMVHVQQARPWFRVKILYFFVNVSSFGLLLTGNHLWIQEDPQW